MSLSIGTAGTRPPPALLQAGFRPFFLLASAYSALAVVTWLAIYTGHWATPSPWPAPYWHAHEMLFGFVSATIAGFLLTAVPNWTNTPRVAGRALAGLVAAWVAGRAALWLAGVLPGLLVAALDLLFLPLLAAAIGLPIAARRLRRNYPVVGVLLLLAAANTTLHVAILAGNPIAARRSLHLALYAVLGLLAIISGRIVPLFTRGALRMRGIAAPVESRAGIERALVFVMPAAIVLAVAAEGSWVSGGASLVCGALLLLRQSRWQPWLSRDQPIVWILHVGHAWLGVGFLCQGLAALTGIFPASTALHALSAGALGTSIIGVMSRVSLGHSGREIKAGPAIVCAYLLVILAGVVRVFGPFVLPASYELTIVLAGGCWAAGYGLFALTSFGLLARPRADGQPG